MGLSYNQFRLLKSRAKARFGELGKEELRPGVGINLRKDILKEMLRKFPYIRTFPGRS